MKSDSELMQLRVNALNHSVRQMKRLEKECKKLRKERDTLRRNRGKFGHGCNVETSFFGTHVEMGEKRDLRVTFYWHAGRPALKIQTKRGVPPLEFVVEEDGTLEVIDE